MRRFWTIWALMWLLTTAAAQQVSVINGWDKPVSAPAIAIAVGIIMGLMSP